MTMDTPPLQSQGADDDECDFSPLPLLQPNKSWTLDRGPPGGDCWSVSSSLPITMTGPSLTSDDLYDLYELYGLYDLHDPDLYCVAHVAVWKPYDLHDLAHISWVGPVLHRSCPTSHNGR